MLIKCQTNIQLDGTFVKNSLLSVHHTKLTDSDFFATEVLRRCYFFVLAMHYVAFTPKSGQKGKNEFKEI